MIWDSTETNDYDSPVFYRGESLQGPWKKWKKASNLKNGLVISSKSFGVRDNLLVAGFATDWLYSNLKKCPEDYYVSCITPQGTWTRVTWPKEKCPDNFHVWGTKNICLEGDDIITSENGYEWTKVASKISSTDALLDVGDFLFLPPHSGNKAYLSNDGVNFSEIALSDTEPCAWENFTTNGKEILATLKISEKEVFLRKGIIQILD
jgi:hypothetical protein